MKPDKRNPFMCAGRVNPGEYDWRAQFNHCAKQVYRTGECERVFDVGKVLGIVDSYDQALKLLEQARNLLNDSDSRECTQLFIDINSFIETQGMNQEE